MATRFKLITSLGIALLLLTACSNTSVVNESTEQPSSEVAQSEAAPETTATDTQTAVDQLKFKRDDGSEAFSIKFQPDGAKWVDSNDQELARFNLDENQKVKIKDASDNVLGFIVIKDGYWKVENAEQTQELFILRRQDDGDYKLEDGSDTQIYRIKKRDYGYEIETPEKESLYKVKVSEDGKVSLRNASDETVISTRAPIAPIAVASFGFDVLSPEQQAALAFAVNYVENQ